MLKKTKLSHYCTMLQLRKLRLFSRGIILREHLSAKDLQKKVQEFISQNTIQFFVYFQCQALQDFEKTLQSFIFQSSLF